MPYDVARDFAARRGLGTMPTALMIAPSKGIKTMKEFVAEAKAKPGGSPSRRPASARPRTSPPSASA